MKFEIRNTEPAAPGSGSGRAGSGNGSRSQIHRNIIWFGELVVPVRICYRERNRIGAARGVGVCRILCVGGGSVPEVPEPAGYSVKGLIGKLTAPEQLDVGFAVNCAVGGPLGVNVNLILGRSMDVLPDDWVHTVAASW